MTRPELSKLTFTALQFHKLDRNVLPKKKKKKKLAFKQKVLEQLNVYTQDGP